MAETEFDDDARVLSNGLVAVRFAENKGTYDVADGEGRVVIAGAALSASLGGGVQLTTRGAGFTVEDVVPTAAPALGRGRSVVLRREADEHEPDLLATVSLFDGERCVLVDLELINRTPAPLEAGELRPLDGGRAELGVPPAAWRFYKQGWQSWTPTLVLPVSGEDMPMQAPVIGPGRGAEPAPGRFVSELMTALAAPGRRGLVAGFVTAARQFSQLRLEREGAALTAVSHADGAPVAPGQALSSERLYILPADDPLPAMGAYGDVLAAEMEAVPYDAVASGWCSWYQYFTGVTEERVLANLEFLASHRRALPVDYVQIDDGYQAAIGDWLTVNEKFPRGMKWLAGRIHEAGFKAGIWLAPFLMGEQSELWRRHPEWAVIHESGRPYVAMLNWNQRCYAIDVTRDDVIRWLNDVFTTVCHDWGFDYVKIDFVYAAAVDGIRQDRTVTRAEAYRRGLETIRDAVGDRFVLGCGSPIGPSVGLVDGARIGPDVAPSWRPVIPPALADTGRADLSQPSALNSVRNAISRFWMHGRLWMNDPDCLLVRDFDTTLSADEVHTLAAVIGLSGGMVLDSDDLTRLSPERLRLLSFLLPVYGRAAVPLDLFENDPPQVLELDCGGHSVLALFNWADAAAEVAVPLRGPSHVFDVWRAEYLGLHTHPFRLEAPAHGCRLLRITPAAGRPQVVGSTFHIAQGALELGAEEWARGALRLGLRPVAISEGELFLAAEGLAPAGDGALRAAGPNCWALRLTVDEPRTITVPFA